MFETKVFTQPNETVIAEIHEIQTRIFEDPFPFEKIRDRISGQKSFLSIHGYAKGRIVCFKTGFSLDNNLFYSWIGGVESTYRNSGLGKTLMMLQHEHLKALGFAKVQTKTQNRFRDMIILNLKSGFEITSTFIEEGKGLQILLEKRLKNESGGFN